MTHIPRRSFIRTVATGAAATMLAPAARAAGLPMPNRSRPNIVYILADDMGYGDLAINHPANKVPTPNLDRLASQGMRFTDAHSPSAVCTPTRYGILTGRYCWRSRLAAGVLWVGNAPLIDEDRLTVADLLKDHGYRTGCVGKWHLGWNWPTVDGEPSTKDNLDIDWSKPITGGPLAHGFDYYFGDDVPNFPPYVFIENERAVGTPDRDKPKDMYGHPGPMVKGWKLERVLPEITRRACRFIEESADSDQPFFLYFPLTAPHTPIAPSERFQGKTEADRYGDFVHEVDAMVGRVMRALERSGQAENTLVIFTSDNGSPARDGTNMGGGARSVERTGHIPNAPWRGIKAGIWEGGHRVPFIARWPGEIAPGSTCDETITHTDFMRTVAAILGADLPDDAAEDSFDILPALIPSSRGNGSPDPLQSLRGPVVHHSGNGQFAVRDGRWKLNLCPSSGGWETLNLPDAPPMQLYDLRRDPKETTNLYHTRPDKVDELTAALAAIVEDGRSTPGAPQSNDRDVRFMPKITVAKDETGRFDYVRNCQVTKHAEGFVLESAGIGHALKKLDKPLTEPLTVEFSYQSLAEAGSRNALLVFGEEPDEDELVKCGTLIVAGSHAIWRGTWNDHAKGVAVEHSLDHAGRIDVSITIDPAKREVSMTVAGETLTAPIPAAVKSVRYIGYLVNGTKTLFVPRGGPA